MDINTSTQAINILNSNSSALVQAQEALALAQEAYLTSQNNMKDSFSKVPQLISNLKSNIRKSKAYRLAESSLHQDLIAYKKDSPRVENESLRNLLKDLDIVEVSFKERSTGKLHQLSLIKDLDPYTNILSETDFNKKFTLDTIHFLTKTPQAISVDGSQTNLKVGGPYEVKLRHNIMQIRPASLDAYYAPQGEVSNVPRLNIISHPHSAGSLLRSNSNSFSWENCCLGEVSSILYKAWHDANFVQIFIAVNLWLKSANSTDPWGRRYKDFETWADHQAYQEYSSTRKTPAPKQEEPSNDSSKQEKVLPTVLEVIQPVTSPDIEATPAVEVSPVTPPSETSTYTPYIQTR